MPLKVPGESSPSPFGAGMALSDTDLMMALATMKSLGRIPTFDERFRGQDPASLPMDVRQDGKEVVGVGKDQLRQMKQDKLNPGTADKGLKLDLPGTKDNPRSLESLGVYRAQTAKDM